MTFLDETENGGLFVSSPWSRSWRKSLFLPRTKTFVVLMSWTQRVNSGWGYVGLNTLGMRRTTRSSYHGKHLLPESGCIKSSLLWCFRLRNPISSQLIWPPVVLTRFTVRLNSRAAFDALCIEREANPPNRLVLFEMLSARMLLTVTAIFSAVATSEMPWMQGLAQEMTIYHHCPSKYDRQPKKHWASHVVNIVLIHESKPLIVNV